MKSLRLLLFLTLIGSLNLFLISCDDGEDDAPLPPKPTVSFVGGSGTTAERGEDVDIQLEFNAPSGIASIVAAIGSSSVELTITQGDTEGTADYTYSVASDAEFGPVDIVFTLTDQDNRDVSATYTVTVTGSTVLLSDSISVDTSLEKENLYFITNDFKVPAGVTLTIPAGTTIYARDTVDTDGEAVARLKVEGAIVAEGTAAEPIVFTSERVLTNDAEAGLWQGIRIEGSAGVSSGTLRYVRIEYAGNGQAGLRLNSVDASTEIDYVQVYRSAHNGLEARDGTVNFKHVVLTENSRNNIRLDDDDNPYKGFGQYIIIQNTDSLSKPQGDASFREFEIRDDAEFTVANFSIIGPGYDKTGSADAVRVRNDAGSMRMFNSLIAEFPDDGFRYDVTGGDTSYPNGDFVLAHSYIFRIKNMPTRDDSDPESLPLVFETDAATYFNVIDADQSVTPSAAVGIGVSDYVPDAKIPSTFDISTLGSFFENNDYVGAIGDTDWTVGWTLDRDGNVQQ